ncbi:MAG TPA: LuxR C-terminal-related transcriptional regulator [Candidatus Baltobacteraceae bacterium]|nr:LuxR C-terminal-related transcriptional regulator [Candidatus Baltobacteraceae bacterium]
MSSTAANPIEALFLEARFEQAARAIAASHADAAGDEALRRLSAAVFAAQGRGRDLAAVADLSVLGCRSAADAVAWCSGIEGGAQSHDYLTAGVILAGSGDREAAYDMLREAHDRALYERRFHVAVSARERLAHHAVLFGDTSYARTALDESLVRAGSYELIDWRTYCSSRLAALAIDTDDFVTATDMVTVAAGLPRDSEALALFAPSALRLAARNNDAAQLERWSAPDILVHARTATDTSVVVAATMASLLAAGPSHPLHPPYARTLRRALLMIDTPSSHVEFLAMAARCGDADEGRIATAMLGATFAPQRRYLEAHYRLARAYQLLRGDDRAAAIDSAGDAARAFDAIGMRIWANEAMLLLVRHDELAERPLRRRPSAISLTRREQQVAHLIRRGASNREVAHALQISEHTVERHVSSILSRLGLRSRWQIVDARISGAEH